MKVTHRSLVYDASQEAESRAVAFMDSLISLASGTWLSGFTVGPKKNAANGTVCLSRSRDGGRTWTVLPQRFDARIEGQPGSLSGAEMVEVAPGRLLLFTTWFDRSDPERPLFNPETEGILASRQLLAVSTDEGDSWSEFKVVETPGLTGSAMSGPVGQWSDGTIGFVFESFKEFDDPTPVRPAAWLLISRDGGESFQPPFMVARDPRNKVYYWDQRLCPGSEADEFISLFWTHDRASQRDLNVHFLRSTFSNGQAAPDRPVETSIPGQIAAPCLLEDGRILAFVVNRDRPGTMRLWQSSDGGLTWPEAESLEVHRHDERAALSQGPENIDFAEYWEDMDKWSFGHPCVRVIDRNQVMLTWYAGTPTCMSVHCAAVEL